MSSKIILALILLLSAVIRFVGLESYPSGFSGDEAQQVYSAFSIYKTGKDEWGETFPLNPRGFGDYKPPIYTYLTIPSVALFGLSATAARFPAATAGIVTVLVVFLLAKQLFNREDIALWSSFLLAISPWHVQISRTAFEGGVGALLFSLGLLFFLKSKVNQKYLYLSAVLWGLTLYTYHSFRVLVILFVVFLCIFKKFILHKPGIIAVTIFLVFLVPIFYNLAPVSQRASDVGIFNPKLVQGYFESKGLSPLPYQLDRLFDNKAWFIISKFFDNYLGYFSPTFFFTGARSDGSYLNFPGFGLLYPIEIIYLLWAIVKFIKSKADYLWLILLWWFTAPLPASLADGSMVVNRAVTLLPLITIISGFGVVALLDVAKKYRRLEILRFKLITFLILIISFAMFVHYYLVKIPQRPPESLRYGYKEVFNKVFELEGQFDEVIISKSFNEPQIFLGFYGKIDPARFQKASLDWLRYEVTGARYIDQLESWNLEKFLFEGIEWEKQESLRVNALVVGKKEEFPESIKSLYDFKDDKGRVLYKLVPSKQYVK